MSNLNKLAWNDIDWSSVERRTFRMQRRIYKAKQKDKMDLVHHLQNRLIQSLDAKLLSIRQVTTLNLGKNTSGYDDKIYKTPKEKLDLAYQLKIDGKSDIQLRIDISQPGKKQSRALGIPTLRDRAKQNLVKLALEPEWEAVFEPSSYGFRPGKSCQDAIETIFMSTRSKPRYVLDADISQCFDQIDHKKLLLKLNAPDKISNQIKAWLEADIFAHFSNREKMELNTGKEMEKGTLQGGIISPLLANIALHGLGTYLKEKYVNSKHSNKRQEKIQRAKELGYIRYADDFVVIGPNLESVEEAKQNCEDWLKTMGLSFNPSKTNLTRTTQGFHFLGFHIILIKRNDKYRCKIHISSKSKKQLISKCGMILKKNRASSSYALIKQLAPIVMGWGYYFQYSECSKEFQSMDHKIFGLLRSWVFRRKAQGLNRTRIKEKYFPSNKVYIYHGVRHEDNWVLNGTSKTKDNKILTNYLPKLSWLHRQKFVKM